MLPSGHVLSRGKALSKTMLNHILLILHQDVATCHTLNMCCIIKQKTKINKPKTAEQLIYYIKQDLQYIFQ